jgi:hypothetical protein
MQRFPASVPVTPIAYSYRGGVITQTAPMTFRADMNYVTLGHYTTMSAARAAVTRAHKAKLASFNAECAAARAVPEYRDIVAAGADLARSLANRLACSGLTPALQVYATKHAFVITHANDPADRAGLVFVGEIPLSLPYSQFADRLYTMGRNAPLY